MNAQLIIALINLGFQFGPELVKDVATLIHGNPQQQGETVDAYVARVGGIIDANTAKVIAEDKDIQS